VASQGAKSIRAGISAIKGIHHIGISVANLAESLVFFEGATTLTKHSHSSFSGAGLAVAGPADVAVLKGPNSYIELMQFDPAVQGDGTGIPVEGPGVTHICFQSPAELKMYDMFTNQKAIPVTRGTGPVDLGGYGVHYAYLRNNDQTMFEVEQIDNAHFEGPVWIAHVALVSHDIDRLVDFYSSIFAIEPYRRVNKVVGPRIEEVTDLDNVRVRAAWFNVGVCEPCDPGHTGSARPFEKLGFNKYAFEVADINSEIPRLKALGVNFSGAVQKTAIGQEVYATDPDGNCFSLLQLFESELSIDHLSAITWETV
jgi:catechol 2,3-dioxygenase-like lactoylglutathione lyase family enzyme